MAKFEVSVSGFQVEGKWSDIVEHGEKIAYALKQIGIDDNIEEEFNEYNDWRPKASENLNEDVQNKTAEKASIDDSGDESPKDSMKKAGEEIVDSYKNANKPKKMVSKWGDSARYTAKGVGTIGKKILKGTEETVYKNMMTSVSPYYFDNKLISANLTSKSESEYVFEVNINEDELKHKVQDKLEEYEEKYDRWHISTKYDADSVQNAEGERINVDKLEQEDEDNPNPMLT